MASMASVESGDQIVRTIDGRGTGATPLARRWALVVGAWTVVAAFSLAQIYVAQSALGHPPPLGALLLLEVPVWAFWALLTVPIVLLARCFPLDRGRVVRALAIHTGAAIAIGLVSVAFQMLWYQAFNPYPIQGSDLGFWFWQYFRRYFVVGVVIYWAAIGVYYAFTNYFLYRDREVEASRVKAQLSEARLSALKMQIHPHFLFNTLNSVSALLERQPAEARRVLAQLAELMRASLKADARHLVPLEEEIEFLRRYLDLERIRLGDRLEVSLSIDPDVRRAAVPSFLFQPLVENAIRHGIARREGGGRMWISAVRDDDSLVIHVVDDGPGLGRRPAPEGIGLANTRRRLRELFGSDQHLVLHDQAGAGLAVRVEIPFRELGRSEGYEVRRSGVVTPR